MIFLTPPLNLEMAMDRRFLSFHGMLEEREKAGGKICEKRSRIGNHPSLAVAYRSGRVSFFAFFQRPFSGAQHGVCLFLFGPLLKGEFFIIILVLIFIWFIFWKIVFK